MSKTNLVHETFGYRLFWQYWRDHQIGNNPPPKESRDFDTKESAEKEKKRLHDIGITATILPIPMTMCSRERIYRSSQDGMGFPIVLGGMRTKR